MKKFLLFCLSAAISVSCAAAIAACGSDNSAPRDKAYGNSEFIGYRKKVAPILRDAGFAIKDFDGADKSAAVLISSENKNALFGAMEGAPLAESAEGAKSLRYSAFDQSFYSSLMLGDGLSNYCGVNAFYNIAVCFDYADGKKYMQVENSGGGATVYGFSPEEDSFTVMSLEYRSATNYNYTYLQFKGEGDEKFFIYGEPDRFIAASKNSACAYFIDGRGERAYGTEESSILSNISEKVKDTFTSQNTSKMRALSNAKYSLDESQLKALTEKYYGSSSGPHTAGGVEYGEVNGEKIALICKAEDGAEEIQLEYGTAYIASDFTIEDNSGTVKALRIPNSVKGIKLVDNGRYITVPVDRLKIKLKVNGEDKILERITVESGSRIFRSGTGSLSASDGKVIYLADGPLSSLDSFAILSLIDTENIGAYKNLFTDITALNIDLNALILLQTDGFGATLKFVMDKIFAEAPVTSLTVTSSPTEYDLSLGLVIPLKRDISIDVSLEKNCSLSVWLYDISGSLRTASVSVKKLPEKEGALSVLPYEDRSENLAVAISVAMARDCYEILYDGCIKADEKLTEFTFNGSSASGFNRMRVLHTERAGDGLAVIIDELWDGAQITVPDDFYGVEIVGVMINTESVGNRRVSVYLPKNIKFLDLFTRTAGDEILYNDGGEVLYAGGVNNEDFVLRYDGTYRRFNGLIIRYDLKSRPALKVVCTDGWFYYPDGINEEDAVFLTVVTDDGAEDFRVGNGTAKINLGGYTTDENYAYYLIDGNGIAVEVVEGVACVELTKSRTMTLCKLLRQSGTYRITGEGYDLNIRLSHADAYYDGENRDLYLFTVLDGTLFGLPVAEKQGELFEVVSLVYGDGEEVDARLTLGRDGLILILGAYESYVDISIKIGDDLIVREVGRGSRFEYIAEEWNLQDGYKYYLRDISGRLTAFTVDGGYVTSIDTNSRGDYALIRMTTAEQRYTFGDITVTISGEESGGDYNFTVRVTGVLDGERIDGTTKYFGNTSLLKLEETKDFAVLITFNWSDELDARLSSVNCILDR